MAMESLDQRTVRRPGDVKADCGHGLEADGVGLKTTVEKECPDPRVWPLCKAFLG